MTPGSGEHARLFDMTDEEVGAEAAAAKDLPEMASGLKNLSGVLGDLGPAAAVFSKAGVAGLGLAALLTWVEVFPRAVVGLLHALGVDSHRC